MKYYVGMHKSLSHPMTNEIDGASRTNIISLHTERVFFWEWEPVLFPHLCFRHLPCMSNRCHIGGFRYVKGLLLVLDEDQHFGQVSGNLKESNDLVSLMGLQDSILGVNYLKCNWDILWNNKGALKVISHRGMRRTTRKYYSFLLLPFFFFFFLAMSWLPSHHHVWRLPSQICHWSQQLSS